MLTTEIKDNFCVMKLESHLSIDDIYEMVEFSEEKKVDGVLLNLENLSFMTSSTIGLLTRAYASLKEISIPFGIFQLDKRWMEMLHISGVDTFLPIFDDVEHGKKKFLKK